VISQSQFVINLYLKQKLIENMLFSGDVRDCALAHIKCMTSEKAVSKRQVNNILSPICFFIKFN
jgi:hypothetical protein